MDLFTFLLCKKKGGGGLTYTLSADTVNKQIVLTPSEGDAQAITVPYATDASTVNGKDVPELENGKIPATYLPSYVDDVLEYEDLAHFPAEGEIGKIYIALDTSLIYRWSGSVYAEISQSLALGETEATAYRGDRGKIAYDHSQSAHAPSNAEANQNAFSNVKIGSTTIAADSKTDTLELEAGDNIELTPDSTNDKITVSGIPVTRTIRDVNIASFSDGSNAPIPSLTASIVPVQDLHGYDSPWVGGAGKNKLPMTEWFDVGHTETSNGITITVLDEGKIKVSGTNTELSNTDIYLSRADTDYNKFYIKSGTYTVSCEGLVDNLSIITSGGSNNGFPYTALNRISSSNTGNVTDETKPFNYFLIRVAGGATVNATIGLQLELGSTATTYAPYSNICPISGWTGANVYDGSGNLCDITKFTHTGITNDSGSVNTINSRLFSDKIFIKPNYDYTYTIVGSAGSVDPQNIYCNRIIYYDASGTFLSRYNPTTVSSATFTPPANARYFVMDLKTYSNYDIEISDITSIMVNIGSTAQTYTPYAGTTTTIPFTDGQGQSHTSYGGQIDVISGKEDDTYGIYQKTNFGLPTIKDNKNRWEFGVNLPDVLSDLISSMTRATTDYDLMCNNMTIKLESDASVGETTCSLYGHNNRVEWRIRISDEYTAEEAQAIANASVIRYPINAVTLQQQPTSIKSLDGENNVFASTGALREVTYRTQAYGDFIATRDLPDAISNIKTLKLDENQILIGDGNFNKIGLFMDDYYDENLDATFTTEVTPQEIYLTSQPAESVNQTTIISGDRTEYQTSLLSGTEVINTVSAIGMEVNVKENGSITHGIKIVSGDIRLLGSDTWDGTNISLKNALEAIQNNLYIANYNKTASLSSGSNTVALDMTGYTYNGSDVINVYVDGLYKINNTDYTITVNSSTGVASINYTAAAAATMAIQVIKPKIGFTALTDNNGDNVTDNSGNNIDI